MTREQTLARLNKLSDRIHDVRKQLARKPSYETSVYLQRLERERDELRMELLPHLVD